MVGVYLEVNAYQVVSSIDLGVGVDNRSSGTITEETRVSSNLASSDPVVRPAGCNVVVHVISCGDASSWLKEGDSVLVLGSVEDRLDTSNDNLLVGSVVEKRVGGDLHIQVGSDSHATPGNHTGTQVLTHGDQSISRFSERPFSTNSPLDLASDTISTDERFPCHSVRSRSSSGEDTGAAIQVQVHIGSVGVVVGTIEIVGFDTGLAKDKICVGMVQNVVSNRKPDPARGRNHGWAISAGLNNVELISWADTTAEEDLGGSECSGRKDDPSSVGCDAVDTNLTTWARSNNLDTSDSATGTEDLGDSSVDDNLEVGACFSSLEVGSKRTTTFTVGIHEGSVGEGPVLGVRNGVGGDLGPASGLQNGGHDSVRLLNIADSVHGRVIGRRNSVENFGGRRDHVGRLPASREVVIPIAVLRFEEQASINSGTTTENTSSHLVDIVTSNTGRVNPNLVAKTWDIEAGEFFASQPGRTNSCSRDVSMYSLCKPLRE